ncbi:hypothetical protein MUP77_22545, partial [Candidatus Bathyarchaeota archaeon]|nr:hypothetical protein [Candidatus Bathyarchaeota archaeon]
DFNTGTFAQTNIVGSGTGASLSLGQYTAPLSTTKYVSNIVSDVDQSPGTGFHSSFVSQQSGPDSNYDTLTEQGVALSSLYQQVTVTSQKSTSLTGWTDVPQASVSFTPSSTTERWLVIVTADIRSNSLSDNQARFRYLINGVPNGETGVKQGTTSSSPDPYNVYFHFSQVTGTTLQQTVIFQFQANSGRVAYTRNVHILCIRIDWAGLEYIQFNGEKTINGTSAAPQTLANLQFTPSSSGNYIVMYSALVSKGTWAGAETWLSLDSGASKYPNAWTTPNTRRIETEYAEFEPHGLFTQIYLNAINHNLSVQSQLRTAGDTCTARDVRIAAFRVDAFDSIEYDEDITQSSTTSAETVRSTVTTAVPGEQRDYLVLAGIETISSGTSSREAGGIKIDGTTVQSKGDTRLSSVESARIASQYAGVKTTSASFTVETTYGRGTGSSNTVYSKQSVIYVLKLPKTYKLDLEEQFMDVSQSFRNRTLCIKTGNLGSEALQVDLWNATKWENLNTAIAPNSWNNFTITLNSSTYTIRFRDTTSDSVNDSWNIDCVLLRLQDDNYPYYYSSGSFISQKEDAGGISFFDQISWTEICPNGTDTGVQIRSASTAAGLDSAQWYGPTGTSDYYVSSQGSNINTIHNNDQWFQYRVYLTSANPALVTPELLDLTINYRLFQYYTIASDQVRVLFYNIPILSYHLSNDYFELLLPTQAKTLVQNGSSAPVTQVFAIQKNPILGQDDYIRGVVAPVIRYVTANISSGQQSVNYVKLYLPNLVLGNQPEASQSITLSGMATTVSRESNVERIRIIASFPQGSSGFDNSFFHFPQTVQEISVTAGSELEFYRSEVRVDIGL